MATKMTTLIEQFSVVGGTWRSSPYNQAAVREPKRSPRGKGNLFVLVEAQGQISQLEIVEERLIALVRDTYYPANGGVTASLRRAIQTTNMWLFQQNSAAQPDKQIVAGVAAIVIKDEDLFVAQVGPTALFSKMDHGVQRYPEWSSWLDQDQAAEADGADPALGMYHYVDPRVNHGQIRIGDVIILTDGRLARHLSLSEIGPVIQGQNVEAISQNLASLIQIQNCSAMVIQVTAAEVLKQPVFGASEKIPIRIDAGGGKGFNFSVPGILQRPITAIAPKSDQAEPETQLDFDQDADQAQHPWAEALDHQSGLQPSRLFGNIAAGLLAGVAFLGSGLHTILKLVLPGTQTEAGSPRKAGARKPATTATVKQPSYTALKYVALGLPIAVLFITLAIYWYRGYNLENEYAVLLTEAQQKFIQSQSASPAAAVTLLSEAEQQLVEAAAIKEDQDEITTLKVNIIAQRDEIGQVERLYYVPELRRYTDPGTQLDKVIVQGVDIYVLDTGLDRLFHHTLDDIGDTLLPDEGNPLLLQRGQALENAVIGDMIDMVWMPAAGGRQTSDLLILTREGLIEFNPDWGGSPIPISGTELWQSPAAGGSYFGNFYLLDPSANLIHRYLPTGSGYEDPSESYFPESTFVDLSNAIDLAIDGAVYVLYQHGEIKKFLGGEPAPFQVSGLDVPFNNPTAIYTAPDEQVQNLYVADAGNSRIVQLDKEGAFRRQFKPRLEEEAAFSDLKSIYIDEIGGNMFVLSGTSLYAPHIPDNKQDD